MGKCLNRPDPIALPLLNATFFSEMSTRTYVVLLKHSVLFLGFLYLHKRIGLRDFSIRSCVVLLQGQHVLTLFSLSCQCLFHLGLKGSSFRPQKS